MIRSASIRVITDCEYTFRQDISKIDARPKATHPRLSRCTVLLTASNQSLKIVHLKYLCDAMLPPNRPRHADRIPVSVFLVSHLEAHTFVPQSTEPNFIRNSERITWKSR